MFIHYFYLLFEYKDIFSEKPFVILEILCRFTNQSTYTNRRYTKCSQFTEKMNPYPIALFNELRPC